MKNIYKPLFTFLFIGCFAVSQAQEIKTWKLDDLKAAIANTEEPTIFNFWATFCKPCIAEIPYFRDLANKYSAQGVKLVLISLDAPDAFPKKVKTFADKFKVTSQVVYLDESDADLFCPAVDESWSGAIPASMFVNKKNGYRKFLEDELSKSKLEEEINKMLEQK